MKQKKEEIQLYHLENSQDQAPRGIGQPSPDQLEQDMIPSIPEVREFTVPGEQLE
jgi:hypothetical protein